MKKYKEWLTNVIEIMESETSENYPHEQMVEREVVLNLINQPDEPEALSQGENINIVLDDLKEYIKEQQSLSQNVGLAHTSAGNDTHYRQYDYVLECVNEYEPSDDLQNLLVPKQELPVIPKYVAEYLDFAKKEASLIEVLVIVSVGWPTMKKEFSWILANSEIFARAWLDGYEVEEEPLYCVEDGKHTMLCKWESSDGWKVISTVEATEDGLHTDTLVFELTEQEIKDYDARFWPFAKKVEELEE